MLKAVNTIRNSFGWQWLKDIMESYYKDWEITDDEKMEIKEKVASLFKNTISQIDFFWIYK
jgi:ribosome recycling factor